MSLVSLIQCDRCGKREQMPSPNGFTGGTVKWARLTIGWPRYMVPSDEAFVITAKSMEYDVCEDCANDVRFYAEHKRLVVTEKA